MVSSTPSSGPKPTSGSEMLEVDGMVPGTLVVGAVGSWAGVPGCGSVTVGAVVVVVVVGVKVEGGVCCGAGAGEGAVVV